MTPDGSLRKLLSAARPNWFIFSRDGSALFFLRRSETHGWQLVTLDVKSGTKRPARNLAVPPSVSLSRLTRHPDGKRLLTTLGTPRQDIWLLDGFAQPGGWWTRLWRRR